MKSQDRSRLVSLFVQAHDARDNTGDRLGELVSVATRIFGGVEPPSADVKAITEDLADARGWEGKARKSRVSESSIILRASAQLGDAITALRTKGKRDWHSVMKAARRLVKGETVKQAVAYALENASAGSTVSPQGRCAGALKAWHKAAPRKRAEIEKAASILGLEIKWK